MRITALSAALAGLVGACGGGGPGTPDASTIDAPAPPDAGVVACAADYAESADPDNDVATGGTAEDTGLAVRTGGAPATLCGQIDPVLAGDQTADGDFFAFELSDDLRARLELRSADGASATDLEMTLWAIGSDNRTVAFLSTGAFRNEHGVIELGPVREGRYAVSVTAGLPAPAAPVVYTVAVLEDPDDCSGSATITYAEAGDGAASRGNDAVAIEFSPIAAFTETAASDAPEPTAIVLAPAGVAELAGESADVASAGDAYRDRDAFEIATDAVTDELEIRLSWPQGTGTDLDLFVFEAGLGEELSSGLGSLTGASGQESVTVNVAPGATYWLWVGGFDGVGSPPAQYVLRVCARQFTL